MFKRKVPSLVQLCIQTTIDNLRYLGDVGETDIELLKDILPHCTADQLMNIEKSTQGRDLSSVTNNLWRRFFQQQFGIDCFNKVIERMKRNKVSFKWRKLYEAKLEELEVTQKEQVEQLKQKYKEEDLKKQSRQIQICSKVPPSSNKRNFSGGNGTYNNFSSAKGNLMKKAKMEYLNSHEAKVHSAIRKNALQRSQGCHPSMRNNALQRSQSATCSAKPIGLSGKDSASSSKFMKPVRRS